MSHVDTRLDSGLRTLHAAAIAAALALLAVAAPALAQEGTLVSMKTLLDRIQIEDILTRYYYDLSMGKSHELSDYFTEDAVLDVDGTRCEGAQGDRKAVPAARGRSSAPRGRRRSVAVATCC